jgi:uncharacterized Zn finger protein
VAWFTKDDLLRSAGARSYERGIEYVDAVGSLNDLPDGVAATVHGGEPYDVRLFDRDGALDGACSCPYGQSGAFCKHCVAVGLALLVGASLDRPDEPTKPKRKRQSRPKADLRAFLASLDTVELIDLLLELAAEDPALHRRLSLRAATAGDVDATELRRIVNGLRSRGFLDYSRSFGYARKANEVLDALARVAARHPGAVGPLYRLVIQHVTRASEQADDSAGAIGDAAARAVDGYAAACRLAPPNAGELATWIIDFQLDGPGWPETPIGDFADALGADGLATYWQRLAELHQSSSPNADRFDHRTFTINHLRETYLKTVAQDVDALVALYAEDLPEPYRYVQIAETLRDARRGGEAVQWLRRGQAEATRRDTRIDALLADLLTEAGDFAEARDLRWDLFTARPDVAHHRALLDAAERAGTLAETSDRAMAHLRGSAARGGHYADPLVGILLSIGDVDGMWAAANEFRCSFACLVTAAERRGETHPADAISVYVRLVDEAIDRKNKSGYTQAVKTIEVLRRLHQRAGTGDFDSYLAAIRESHRRKTAFMAELARALI